MKKNKIVNTTVKENHKEWLLGSNPNAIEYPERYGFHSPMDFDSHIFDDQDFIQATCIGRDDKKRRLYIMHHY